MNFRLALLVAPAWSGKTTLLRDWVGARGWPAAWVTLTPEDNLPGRFLSDLLAAIQAIGLPSTNLPEDAIAGLGLTEEVVDLLNAVADYPDDWMLVLDDYHVIESEGIHGGVSLMLDYAPPPMHVVIASRSEPPLQLPRLRVRRQLLELRLEDLERWQRR